MAKAPTPGLTDKLDGKVSPDDDGPKLTAQVGAEVYEVELRRLTARLAGELRTQAGYSVAQLVGLALTRTTIDADVAAVVVWLARRQAGEVVSLVDVSEGITVGDLLDAIPDDEEAEVVEEAGDPKG